MPCPPDQLRVKPGGAKYHDNTPAEVDYYIDRASKGAAKRMGTCTHPFATKEAQPLLRKGVTNRILLYPGAFNPPHRGHMLVLQHGFRECGEDFNVVAAIVVMKRDDYLEYKNEQTARELLRGFLLDLKTSDNLANNISTVDTPERAALWSTDVHFPDWAWILSEDDVCCCVDDKIVELAKADGFDVELVMLIGPDNFDKSW